MDQKMKERIQATEKRINEYFEQSKITMLQKNNDRGDCWRNSGLLGQFLEIHSMYFRLRRLIWDIGPPAPTEAGSVAANLDGGAAYICASKDFSNWKAQIVNALEDLRNFTMLAEMCLEENNWRGDEYADEKLDKGGK